MGRRVAIIGTGQTYFASKRDDVSNLMLVYEAVRRALDDAGLSLKDIDGIVYASSPEMFHGSHMPDLWLGDGCGANGKPFFRFGGSGTVSASASIGAFAMVASGLFDTMMVVAGDELSGATGGMQYGVKFCSEPTYETFLSPGTVGGYACMAVSYLQKFGYTPEEMSMVSVKDHANGVKNEYAHLKLELTLKQIREAPMLAYPLTLYDACPTSDGGACMILACEEKATKITDKPVWVKGVAKTFHARRARDLDWSRPPRATYRASEQAYKMAGITNPLEEVDVFELYTAFSHMEPLWLEGLHVWEEGEALRHIADGETSMTGKLPVNPSGGPLCTNPVGPTAMLRIVEAYLQIAGKAGAHQVPDVKTAVAHGLGGIPHFQSCVVLSDIK